MAVGGVSAGAAMPLPGGGAMATAQAVASAQAGMLDQLLEMAVELNAQLLEALDAGGAAGVGGSVDAYA